MERRLRGAVATISLISNGNGRKRGRKRFAVGARIREVEKESIWVGTSDKIVERLRPVIDAGIDYVIVYMPRVTYDQGPIQHFAREVIPQFAG
jgi:alkanesulfonate monooxygenase SsuD/methylene tetrahydromethanopterin reductase-like flavin-dependent oxidoreductase (luciferase family)